MRGVEWAWDQDPADTRYLVEYALLLRDGREVKKRLRRYGQSRQCLTKHPFGSREFARQHPRTTELGERFRGHVGLGGCLAQGVDRLVQRNPIPARQGIGQPEVAKRRISVRGLGKLADRLTEREDGRFRTAGS